MGIIMRFPEGKAKAFAMSYDDGIYQDIQFVDIISRYGLKCTFNVNGIIPKKDAEEDYDRLSIKQIKELYVKGGHEVALHSYSHPTLVDLSAGQVTYEYIKNREVLENELGKIIRGSAYPNNKFNDTVVQSLKACGISYARGGVETESFDLPNDWYRFMPTARHTNPKLLEITDKFLELEPLFFRTSALFLLMGHSFEFGRDNNWNLISEFATKISGHKNVWYATCIEIFDYVNAFKQLRFNLAGTIAENPTSQDIWIMKDKKSYKIPASATVILE